MNELPTVFSIAMASLSQLETLVIESNPKLVTFPRISSLSLKTMDLSFNAITSVPQEFFDLPELEWLQCYSNQIESIVCFEGAESLKYIGLEKNKLTALDLEWFFEINPEEVNLRSNKISSIFAADEDVTHGHSITKLMLGDNQLDKYAYESKRALFKHFPALEVLDISDNCLNLDQDIFLGLNKLVELHIG